MELEPIEFEPLSDGHCCDVCNRHHLADYETQCVAIRRLGGNRSYVCLPCLRAMARAARGETQTNAADLQHWAQLSAKADRRKR